MLVLLHHSLKDAPRFPSAANCGVVQRLLFRKPTISSGDRGKDLRFVLHQPLTKGNCEMVWCAVVTWSTVWSLGQNLACCGLASEAWKLAINLGVYALCSMMTWPWACIFIA